MTRPENYASTGVSLLWRHLLVVLAIGFLTINVVTRYNATASDAPSVRTVSEAKAPSQESQRQRLLSNGLHWISPPPVSTAFLPPRIPVRAVSAVFPAIHLDSESWLYNRPPPSFLLTRFLPI
jgi:hypothetical protein